MAEEKTAGFEEGNPIIRHKFTADPTVITFKDKVYLYTGHDEAPVGVEDYIMNEWLCFSSEDLIHWQEHRQDDGRALLSPKTFSWSSGDAYASKVIFRNNKFYWYVAVSHAAIQGKALGVAISDFPTGPFRDARGSALVTQQMIPDKEIEKVNLDPTAIVDDDGQAYLFWGNSKCYYARLKENMTELEGDIKTVDLPGFAEGAHIHKRNGWYYLSYGYGSPEKVAYCMSRSIDGPWAFKGILNEIAGNCETNRPAILEFKGNHYFFYHNGALRNGGSHRRSVCVDYLYYNSDDTMQRVVMTSEGIGHSR